MTLQDKLGILYAFAHCGSRECGNCAGKKICSYDKKREALWEEVWNEVTALIKERDAAREETK